MISLWLVSCAHPQKISTPKDPSKSTDSLVDPNLIPSVTEQRVGEAIATEVLKKYKKLDVSEEFQNYANDIAQNVGKHSHRTDVKYNVFFLDSKDAIALGLPGGKILISKGFLNLIQTESEFASLIGNQIAHIAKQHLVKNLMKNSDYAQSFQTGSISERLIQQSMIELFALGYDINFINEADRLGSTYAMHCGYDIRAFQGLLQKLLKQYEKKRAYGFTDQTFDMMNHRTSMNQVFIQSLEKTDRSSFPKFEDRFATMIKKIKPVKK